MFLTGCDVKTETKPHSEEPMIDTDNYEASGIKLINFPGGEWHVELPKFHRRSVQIFAKIRTWNDAGKLGSVLNALNWAGHDAHLFMPYFPGARQDRVQPGFALTTQIYAQLFAGASTITVVDLHSEKAAEVIKSAIGSNRLKQINPATFLNKLIQVKPDYIISPDAGAFKRAHDAAKALGVSEVVQCEKHRDPKTGAITGFSMPLTFKVEDDKRYLIVDDICDGGATFHSVADAINKTDKAARNASIDLYVTHGIFSRGFDQLKSKFKTIYTTDSFYQQGKDALSIGLWAEYVEGLTP